MGYDEVILRVGKFGRYQRKTLFILFLPVISAAIHRMGGVFLSAKADFRCLLPHENPENATYQLLLNITNMTYSWDYSTKGWPRCERHDLVNQYNDSGGKFSSARRTVKCDSFVYEKSQYTMTVTTEWNLVCDKAWLRTLGDSLFMLGDMPGVLIFGGLSDRYGRKAALLLGIIIQLVCGLLVALSPAFVIYTILRVLVGSTTSAVDLAAYISALEMVSPKKRLLAATCITLFPIIGYLLIGVLAYFITNWRVLQCAFIIPSFVTLVFCSYIPESGRWLLTKGRVQEAKDIFHKASVENGVELSQDTLEVLLKNDVDSTRDHEKNSILDLLRYPSLRKKTLLLFSIWFMISCTYYGLSWNTSNLGGKDYLNFLIAAAVEVPAHIFLFFTLDRWGRRIMLCGSMIVAGLSLLLTFFVPTDVTWLMILLAMVGKMAITASFAIAHVFTAELYPTTIRNVSIGACSAVAKIGGALAPCLNYLFEISTYLPLVILGSLSLGFGLLSLLLPETLNEKMLDSIQDVERSKKTQCNYKDRVYYYHNHVDYTIAVTVQKFFDTILEIQVKLKRDIVRLSDIEAVEKK